MDFPEHYTLVKEHEKHFEIHDARDGQKFTIAKKDLHPANQIKIMKMQQFSDGGQAEDVPDYMKSSLAATKEAQGPEIGSFRTDAGGSDNLSFLAEDRAKQDVALAENRDAMKLHKTKPMDLAPDVQPPQPTASPVPNEIPQAPGPSPASVPQIAQQPMVNPLTGMPSVQGMTQYEDRYEKAILGGAQGQNALNQASAKLYKPILDQQQRLAEDTQTYLEDLRVRAGKISDAIANQKIDPQAYWNNKDSHAKMRAAIGILLSGLSGSQHNMAMDVIQKNIDRDIESQKMELGKKQTLLSDNLRMQGNIIDAERATRAQYEALLQGQIAQTAAKMGNPMIQAKAQQDIMDSRMRMMQHLAPIAQQQAVMNILGGANGSMSPENQMQAMRILAPDRAKELESRYVPNVGFSTIPLTDTDRSQIASRAELNKATLQLEDFAKKHQGSLNPATINEGKALAAQLQDAYRRGNAQGVFKPAEAEFVHGIVAEDPTQFFASYRTLPKYKALRQMNTEELKALGDKVGLKMSDEFMHNEQIKTVNGVRYKRGPKGEAIRID